VAGFVPGFTKQEKPRDAGERVASNKPKEMLILAATAVRRGLKARGLVPFLARIFDLKRPLRSYRKALLVP
jgi:hypothetical protein